MSTRPFLCASLAAASLLIHAGCGSSSDSDSPTVRTTEHAAVSQAPLDLGGLLLVYFAAEHLTGPVGTDLNGDGGVADDVAVVVNLSSTTTTVLRAALAAEIVGDQVYLVVDESLDGTDWNVDADQTDIVLLHWSEAAGVVTFVDVLDLEPGEPMVVAGGRLYYSAAPPPLTLDLDESSIRFVDPAAPTTPVAVLNTIGDQQLEAHILGEDDDLVFLFVDETGGADRNDDGDSTDEHVLHLLDGRTAGTRILNVELALQDAAAPIDAFPSTTSGWIVAFLVDEAEQGGTNLNDPLDFNQPLLPAHCVVPDADAADEVLHFLDFTLFSGGGAAVSTGIAGRDRVLALAAHVATLTEESDVAPCALNDDGDTTDTIVRWVATTTPVAPVVDEDLLIAVEETLPGGAQGLAQLDGRLVIAADEAEDDDDFDGRPLVDKILVGWLDPAAGGPWDFSHQHPTEPSFGTGVFDEDGDSEPFAGTSWMAKDPVGSRLALTFLEEVPGLNPDVDSLNSNVDCALMLKDTDKTDALPVWVDFEVGPTLDFDGVGFAVDPDNAGIVLAAGLAFFRVSEEDDNTDYNADSDEVDFVLMFNPLTTCGPFPMATSSPVDQPVIDDGDLGAAFLSSETQAGEDFNQDGDTTDLVVRYFLF